VLTPRVLDEPVLGTVVLTITTEKNTVVHSGRGAETVIDTVAVESPVSGIKSNSERTVGVKTSNHGLLLAVDITPLGEVILDLALVELASLSNTLVRIILLADHTNTDGIGESIGHETTLATVIAVLLSTTREDHAIVLTVDKLLLRDKRKLLVGNKVGTLHSTSGRESPAGTAALLVLDRSDGTVLNPVLLLGIVIIIIRDGFQARHLVDGHHTKVLGSKLFLRKISKLVELESSLATLTVEVTDKSPVALEVVVTIHVLLRSGVNLTVFVAPINELFIDVNGKNCTDEKGNKNNSLHFIIYIK